MEIEDKSYEEWVNKIRIEYIDYRITQMIMEIGGESNDAREARK